MQFNAKVSEQHWQRLLLLPENADSDCHRQNCCFYSLHRCLKEKSLMKHIHINVCMKRAKLSELKDPPIHTQVLNVFQVLSVISFLAWSSMQMHSKDDVSR